MPRVLKTCGGLTVEERLNLAVAELNLSSRIVNLLEHRLGIIYVDDLLHRREWELRAVKHLGAVQVRKIFRALAEIGFHRCSPECSLADREPR